VFQNWIDAAFEMGARASRRTWVIVEGHDSSIDVSVTDEIVR